MSTRDLTFLINLVFLSAAAEQPAVQIRDVAQYRVLAVAVHV